MYSRHKATAESPVRSRIFSLAGAGQLRPELSTSERRAWTDMQILSHVAFVPAIIISCANPSPLPELAILQGVVLGLSLFYHRNYERQGPLANAEGIFAKLLFLYGTVQTFHSPTTGLLAVNSACFCLTAGTFVVTNMDSSLYERYHPLGLHLIPGLWATLVALFHTSLLPTNLLLLLTW